MMLIIVSEALEGPESHPICSKCNSVIMFVIVGNALCILMCVCVSWFAQPWRTHQSLQDIEHASACEAHHRL